CKRRRKLNCSEDTDASHSDSPSAAIASLVLLTLAASERAVSAGGLADRCFILEQPSGAIRAYDSRGSQIGRLTVTGPADEAIRNLRPHRVRICKQRRVVIVDRANCSVLVCESDGSLSFRVGPNFANDGQPMTAPEDAVSTGLLLAICSPEFGLYLVSLSEPDAWRTTVRKGRCGLVCPVRLGWLASRKWLVVADETPNSNQYRLLEFVIKIGNKSGGEQLAPQGSPFAVQSLSRPSLLCGDDFVVLAIAESVASRLLLLTGSGLRLISQFHVSGEDPIADLFWLKQPRQLVGCHGNKLRLWPTICFDSCGSFEEPSEATPPLPDAPASIACLSDRCFILNLPSGTVRVSELLINAVSNGDKLALTKPTGAQFDARPTRVRVCAERNRLILVDQTANMVHLCSSEGRLLFSVGPQFTSRESHGNSVGPDQKGAYVFAWLNSAAGKAMGIP
uniref:MMS1_N domain-containing protein n=1 Tax=Macrostomum lignano TaxID=282301 RepID=A0A1I8JSE3_9PLAT